MSSAISAVTPRLFPQLHAAVKLTANDLPTSRIETPPVQNISNHVMPAPDKEVLMATALASWAPLIARGYIEQDKKKESEALASDYTLAA